MALLRWGFFVLDLCVMVGYVVRYDNERREYMSAIITSCHVTGRKKICIYAPDPGCLIHGTDLVDTVIEITGDADLPFIDSVRLTGCTVIAENMGAFNQCFFDDDCDLIVKSLPLVVRNSSTAESINHNRVAQNGGKAKWPKQKTSD